MKKLTTIILHSSFFIFHLAAVAAVPLRWTVETNRIQPAQFEGYHGETIEFAATMQTYGKPLAITNDLIGIYWQTNGMGSAYWTYPAVLSNNVMIARWTPSMDVGANVYSCFIGAPGEIYRAAFQLRLRPSPGAVPAELPLPVQAIDFSQVEVRNAPWLTTESDPTVPSWAKSTSKPSYTASEVGVTMGSGAQSVAITVGSAAATMPTFDFFSRMLSYKQDTISDLASIRSGAAAGATAVQPAAISDMETKTHAAATYASKSSLQSLSDTVDTMSDSIDSKLDKSGGMMTGDLYIPNAYLYLAADGEFGSHLYKDYLQIGSQYPEDGTRYTQNQIECSGACYEFPSHSGTLALTSDIPDISTKAEQSDLDRLTENVSTWSSFWSGDDVRVTVTNYDSAVNLPSLYLEYKLSNGTFRTVWDERTRWDINDRRMAAVETAVEGKADRAWGYYDSHTGGWAPDGYTWLSSPKIAISAGMAYQKHVTSEGAVWVLESNGLVSETGGSVSNGFFRVSDDEGNSLFEIVKGDKRTVGATAGSCETLAGFAITHLQIGYAVESADHPKIYVTRSLTPVDWKDEEDADCPATVNWSGSSGNWTAVVAGKVAEAQLFVKAEYEVGGNTYIKQSAPVSVQKLVLDGREYRVGTATISGHTVLTLTLEP